MTQRRAERQPVHLACYSRCQDPEAIQRPAPFPSESAARPILNVLANGLGTHPVPRPAARAALVQEGFVWREELGRAWRLGRTPSSRSVHDRRSNYKHVVHNVGRQTGEGGQAIAVSAPSC